ncbi:hypothetical protein BB561_000878 [Smittium simulii]|uniref:Uncharacterized protein n=1 Tax=Smittium simulii TaxID=133385 RepID=A0A2T9YXB5_9FUNG|nr:hypothetical protein BB561_000878 [Smittium simulii]
MQFSILNAFTLSAFAMIVNAGYYGGNESVAAQATKSAVKPSYNAGGDSYSGSDSAYKGGSGSYGGGSGSYGGSINNIVTVAVVKTATTTVGTPMSTHTYTDTSYVTSVETSTSTSTQTLTSTETSIVDENVEVTMKETMDTMAVNQSTTAKLFYNLMQFNCYIKAQIENSGKLVALLSNWELVKEYNEITENAAANGIKILFERRDKRLIAFEETIQAHSRIGMK